MKKIFCTSVFILITAITCSAQSIRVLDASEYNRLKITNLLPEKFLLKKTEGNRAFLVPRIHPQANTIQSNASCNCLLPLDTMFSAVPFANGSAPDYRNDDGSSPLIVLPFSFCFFGQTVDSVFINNNGNISFGHSYITYSAAGFPDSNFCMIAPFWADVDTRDTISGIVYYKVTPSSLIVKWERVGYFNMHSNLVNTFQLIITDGNDPLISGGNNTAFCYGDMQWTTGDASQGTSGFSGVPSTVGANLGNGIDYIQFGRFDQPGYGYDGPFGSNDSVDWLDSSSFVFDLCSSNTPPIPYDCNNDTVYLRVGDTTAIDVSFIDPNPGQSVTISVNAGGLANLTTLSNTSGNLSRFQGTLVSDINNLGFNTFTLTATDNGFPAHTTTYNRIMHIDQVTGIQQNHFDPMVSFSPNPFTDHTVLAVSGANSKNISLIISDVTGREVKRVDHVPSLLPIEKGNLSRGIYIYQLTDGDSFNATGKIVIQ